MARGDVHFVSIEEDLYREEIEADNRLRLHNADMERAKAEVSAAIERYNNRTWLHRLYDVVTCWFVSIWYGLKYGNGQ